MIDEEETNASLSDKKEAYVGSQVFQKIRRRILDPVQGITGNLSTVSALEVNVILRKLAT